MDIELLQHRVSNLEQQLNQTNENVEVSLYITDKLFTEENGKNKQCSFFASAQSLMIKTSYTIITVPYKTIYNLNRKSQNKLLLMLQSSEIRLFSEDTEMIDAIQNYLQLKFSQIMDAPLQEIEENQQEQDQQQLIEKLWKIIKLQNERE
ncbi:Hypothetical_protein [Hexamita inflata]|uniref:Hypothetical_protein n=1 Tax=Hexamita inflata TaxID=28002 RepID=A0AA86PL11_9EUKA|nr:Hypothetical protein HINF_LOCUS24759 [Hexamita inflata]CAI9961354.1 Hypothetical protein HINF_LOCUS48999 [Hexamita inflata]